MPDQRDAIPESTKRILRREVGYACPVCRSPFLTWHHFDPPYHLERHNRPEGMIALCPEHHAEADNGHWSVGELRELKRTKASIEEIRGSFPSWQKQNLLVRVGGSYFGGTRAVISVIGDPVISFTKNEVGLLSLSFVLRDAEGNEVVVMQENAFEAYPENLHDLTVAARKGGVRVWLGTRDVGLDLSFDRLTLAELDQILARDREAASKVHEMHLQRFEASIPEGYPEDLRAMIRQSLSIPMSMPVDLNPGSEEAWNAVRSGDPTSYAVRSWVSKSCMDDEGRIPFLDFRQMAIYSHGQRITIRDSIAERIFFCSVFGSDGGVNLACPCVACSQA